MIRTVRFISAWPCQNTVLCGICGKRHRARIEVIFWEGNKPHKVAIGAGFISKESFQIRVFERKRKMHNNAGRRWRELDLKNPEESYAMFGELCWHKLFGEVEGWPSVAGKVLKTMSHKCNLCGSLACGGIWVSTLPRPMSSGTLQSKRQLRFRHLVLARSMPTYIKAVCEPCLKAKLIKAFPV